MILILVKINFSMLEFIFIKEAADELGCKDSRTVKEWCKRNGVEVFKFSGSKSPYLLRAEFEAVKMKQIISYIKEKYGIDKLPENLNSFLIASLFNNNNTENTMKYRPVGKHERNFLKNLQNINSTL
jgi:hypothetical protein